MAKKRGEYTKARVLSIVEGMRGCPRAHANTTEYDAETQTLTLKAGEVVLKDVTAYSRNAKVVHVVAAPGAVFPERSEGMFKDFYYATSIDLSNADMSKVTCMDFMFANCKALTSVKLNDVDTSNVTTMQCLFSGCESLTSLDLTALDTKRTQSMK